MNNFSSSEEPLFDDLIERTAEPVIKPPFYYTLSLLEFWDSLTHGESSTTRKLRVALEKDFAELGISV